MPNCRTTYHIQSIHHLSTRLQAHTETINTRTWPSKKHHVQFAGRNAAQHSRNITTGQWAYVWSLKPNRVCERWLLALLLAAGSAAGCWLCCSGSAACCTTMSSHTYVWSLELQVLVRSAAGCWLCCWRPSQTMACEPKTVVRARLALPHPRNEHEGWTELLAASCRLTAALPITTKSAYELPNTLLVPRTSSACEVCGGLLALLLASQSNNGL